MTNSDKNSASPTNTMLGGVWPVPKACRRIDKTMTIRTNDVIMSNKDGNNVSDVISAKSCSVRLYC